MKLYVRIAVLASTICALLSCGLNFFLDGLGAIPWVNFKVSVWETFFCLTLLYVPLATGILMHILQRKQPWSPAKTRVLGAGCVGVTLGLWTSTFVAILFDGTSHDEFGRTYYRHPEASASHMHQLRDLMETAQALGMLKTFVECFVAITLFMAIATIALLAIYDIAREKIQI